MRRMNLIESDTVVHLKGCSESSSMSTWTVYNLVTHCFQCLLIDDSNRNNVFMWQAGNVPVRACTSRRMSESVDAGAACRMAKERRSATSKLVCGVWQSSVRQVKHWKCTWIRSSNRCKFHHARRSNRINLSACLVSCEGRHNPPNLGSILLRDTHHDYTTKCCGPHTTSWCVVSDAHSPCTIDCGHFIADRSTTGLSTHLSDRLRFEISVWPHCCHSMLSSTRCPAELWAQHKEKHGICISEWFPVSRVTIQGTVCSWYKHVYARPFNELLAPKNKGNNHSTPVNW